MPIDMTAATTPKAPPRKRTTTSGGGATSQQRRGAGQTDSMATLDPRLEVARMRAQGLANTVQMGAGLLSLFGQNADAYTLIKYGPELAVEVANVASMDNAPEWLTAGVDFITKSGPYAGLIGVVMKLGMQLAANHKYIPETTPGVESPEVLAAQMEAIKMQAVVEAARQKRQAAAEMARIQQEMAQMEADMAEANAA